MISLLTSRLGIAGIVGLGLLLVIGWQRYQISDLRYEITWTLSIYSTAGQPEKATAHEAMATVVTALQTEQKAFNSYKLQVEQAISDQANIRIAEAAKQADDQAKLQEANDRLRASYAASTKERNDLSAELLRRLNNAPKTLESALDAGTREYYGRLRDAQLAARPASDPPAP